MASATSFLSYFAKHYPLLTSSTSPNPFLAAQGSIASSSYSLSAESSKHHVQLKYFPPRASAEGAPSELIEDSKFVPLNDDDPVYGPPALLLLGFEVEEAAKIQMLLKELDGEFLEIAKSLPRICFLSGLSGEETMMFMDAFPETGLEPAVFAALVPNSANKPVQELIEEIMGDHEMLTGKQPGFK
ncbi:uncharacterized protein LOC119989319 isoform X3 [Tripterygium wilfordii]|uniref:uncharacterized protein LOC119989319 isoform X3 n=1 Tax=Tripterygium wilfordii TaxID=458696 RepID=UPI0018F831F6|nr:uncharacterized protein LOC119989319 isoform X3 [Tripterygium wilfordii]